MSEEWEEEVAPEDLTVGFFFTGMSNLWKLIDREQGTMKVVIICQLILTTLSLAWPFCMKLIFDDMAKLHNEQTVSNTVLVAMTAIFVIKIGSLALRQFIKERVFVKGVIRLENLWPVKAQDKLLALSQGYHTRENMGKKIAKVNKGCDKMVNIICNLGWGLIPHLFYLVINMVFILAMDLKIGLLFVFPFLIAIIGNVKVNKMFAKRWEKWESLKEQSSGIFCQSIINVATVQSYVQENRERNRLGVVRKDMTDLDIDISVGIQTYFWIIGSLLHLSFVATIAAGLYFVYQGSSTPGTMVFLIATGNITLQSVWEISNIYTRIMRDLVAVNRMKALLDEQPEIENAMGTTIPECVEGKIQLRDVTFIYPSKDQPVLERFSLEIPPGKMVALVGKSGEGKSTIVKLLTRMYEVTEGAILLDGADIRTLDLFWYRKLFATVQQQVEIFDATLLENIGYPSEEYTEEEITRAVKAAHLDSALSNTEKFPEGLETMVGDRGVKLSGGERQRVGIARAYLALLKGARFLILDEATSSLDSEAERAIQEMLAEIHKEMPITIVAIAHRLSTIKMADLINVIQGGHLTEQGDHEQLMRKNGLYSRLVELQRLGEVRD